MRIKSPGHAIFALTMVGLGVLGLVRGAFTPILSGVPRGFPARHALAYVCAALFLACGIGLLWRRTAVAAAGALTVFWGLWFVLWRIRGVVVSPLIDGTWACGETLVMMASSWVLFARFAADEGGRGSAAGEKGLRVARILYGIGLIPFGYAHFGNLKGTAGIIPAWIPWHVFWAYFTGAAFIAAGLAIVFGVWGRLASSLVAWQMGLFTLLVWVPVVTAHPKPSDWAEFIDSWVLTAAGWVIAESYRHRPWLATGAAVRKAA